MAPQPGPVRLAELRSPQIRELTRSKGQTLCVLPVGASEQHGPHLPIGTDTIIATALCEAASASSGVPLLPTLWASFSHAHTTAWPGTFSLGARTLLDLLVEIGAWVSASGFSKLLLVNAHVGNAGALKVAVEELRDGGEIRPGLINWYELEELGATVSADAADWHANAAETALLLHLRPELVDREAIRDDPDRTAGLVLSYSVRETSREGHTGSPSRATAPEGARLFAAASAALAERFERARAEAPPKL
jgi:creatinine amidohydrolase